MHLLQNVFSTTELLPVTSAPVTTEPQAVGELELNAAYAASGYHRSRGVSVYVHAGPVRSTIL